MRHYFKILGVLFYFYNSVLNKLLIIVLLFNNFSGMVDLSFCSFSLRSSNFLGSYKIPGAKLYTIVDDRDGKTISFEFFSYPLSLTIYFIHKRGLCFHKTIEKS